MLRHRPDHKILLGIVLVLAFGKPAFAQSDARLAVERDDGAEDCPDALTLTAQIEAIRGRPRTQPAAGYSVRFSRSEQRLSAAISAAHDPASARVLESRNQDCAALARATAVTLALLFDADTESTQLRPVAPPKPPPRPRLTKTESAAPELKSLTTRQPLSGTLSLGASGVFGVLRSFAPGASLEAGIELRRFRIGTGVLWLLPQTVPHGPGSVHESLVSGAARTCYAPFRRGSLRLDVCTGAYFGVLRAGARGYSENEQRATLFLALPLGLAFTSFSQPIGWELSGGALLPLRRHEFSVTGLGTVYEAASVGAELSVRAVGALPL